jgi:transposase-like protein
MEIQPEGKSKKYSKEEQAEHIARWKESALSQADYSRANNIPPTTFYTWNRKQNKHVSGTSSFIEVKLKRPITGEEDKIELVIRNGIILRMREDISPQIIRGIITGLKGI